MFGDRNTLKFEVNVTFIVVPCIYVYIWDNLENRIQKHTHVEKEMMDSVHREI
jgi:hypothetical protein